MKVIHSDGVMEKPDPREADDGYAKTNKIFTFPKKWDFDKCIKWCEIR